MYDYKDPAAIETEEDPKRTAGMTAVADSVREGGSDHFRGGDRDSRAVTVVPAVLSATTAVETVLMVTEDVHLATATNGADSEG